MQFNLLKRALLVLLLGGIFTAQAWAVTLVQDGKPNGVIVTSADAPDSVRLAASELQHYIEKVSGARLPIQNEPLAAHEPGVNVFIGESAFTRALGLRLDGLPGDGFRLEARDHWLAILGRDYRGRPITGLRNPWLPVEVWNSRLKLGAFGEAGTLHGVYQFLEKYCDIRWYMPGDIGEIIPRMNTIDVPAIQFQKWPAFEYRFSWFAQSEDSDADTLWYHRSGFGGEYVAQIIDSFHFFLKYQEAHPDYFALIGGKRDFTNLSAIAGGGNLCLSNPEVLRQWIADINEYFDRNPEQRIFPVAPNDGLVKICECAGCQAQVVPAMGDTGKFSNYIWNFINQVAAGVAAKHPDKFVGCLAYEAYSDPPSNLARLHPNVAVMICRNRLTQFYPDLRARQASQLARWHKLSDHLYAWDYYLTCWAPWNGFPLVAPHLIAADIKSLQGVIKGEFIQAESWPDGHAVSPAHMDQPAMQHLNLYVTGKLYWDPELDVDRLLNEYYERFYGPAKDEMKAFWSMAEAIYTRPPLEKSPVNLYPDPVNLYAREDLDQLAAMLARARAKTSADSIYARRVELVSAEFLPAKQRLSKPLVSAALQIAVPGPTENLHFGAGLAGSTWENVAPLFLVSNEGTAPGFNTHAYVAWDKENLYFLFANYEPQMDHLVARAPGPGQPDLDNIWADDSIEIFLSPNPSERTKCYQFIVNARGARWDGSYGFGAGASPVVNPAWNSHFEAVTKWQPNRWLAEVKIPLRDVGLTVPVAGRTIALNLYRNRNCDGEAPGHSCWSPTRVDRHFTPERFGLLTFQPK
jgi:hypothetical protein